MANKYAFFPGDWNDSTIWSLSPSVMVSTTVPNSGDVVYGYSGTGVVMITGNVQAVAINAPLTAYNVSPGYFVCNTNNGPITITAAISSKATINPPVATLAISGTNTCNLSAPAGTAYAIASVNSGSTSTVDTAGNVNVFGPGSLNIYGDVRGGNGNFNYGLFIPAAAQPTTININGNIEGSGGGGGGSGFGVFTRGANYTLTVNGNTTNMTNTNAIQLGSFGTLNFYGNVVSSSNIIGINSLNSATINIYGNITSNGTASGVVNTGGNLYVVGNISSGNGAGVSNTGNMRFVGNITVGAAVGISSTGNLTVNTSNIINAANGTQAIYATSYRIDPISTNGYIRYARNGTGIGSDAYLYQYTTDSLSAFSMPPISAVRLGTTFANGTLTGTCAMPSPSSVALGVPVDNTVGTAFLKAADAGIVLMSTPLSSLTVANSLGLRLKNSASPEAIGKIFASKSYE